jgi:hypothetical protein
MSASPSLITPTYPSLLPPTPSSQAPLPLSSLLRRRREGSRQRRVEGPAAAARGGSGGGGAWGGVVRHGRSSGGGRRRSTELRREGSRQRRVAGPAAAARGAGWCGTGGAPTVGGADRRSSGAEVERIRRPSFLLSGGRAPTRARHTSSRRSSLAGATDLLAAALHGRRGKLPATPTAHRRPAPLRSATVSGGGGSELCRGFSAFCPPTGSMRRRRRGRSAPASGGSILLFVSGGGWDGAHRGRGFAGPTPPRFSREPSNPLDTEESGGCGIFPCSCRDAAAGFVLLQGCRCRLRNAKNLLQEGITGFWRPQCG